MTQTRRYTGRNNAKRLLYEYRDNVAAARAREAAILAGDIGQDRDRQYNKGGISDPTAQRGLKLAQDRPLQYIRAQVRVVDILLARIQERPEPVRSRMQQLISNVYFYRTCTLYGLAAKLGVNQKTINRANALVLDELDQLWQKREGGPR